MGPHMIRWSEDHLTLRVSFSYHKSPPCQVWWPWVLKKRRYFVFVLFCNLIWPRGQRIMWHYCRVIFIISHHPANWWSQALFKRKYFVFILPRDITWLSVQRATWHYRWFYLVIWLPCKSFVIINLLQKKLLNVTWLHMTTWSEDHVTSLVSSAHYKSSPY